MLIFAVRLILEDNGKLLFLKQTQKNGGRYSLIGGNVEDHEFAREALVREALEETGIRMEPSNLHLVHVLHRHKLKKDEVYLVLYFKVTQFYGDPESREPKKFKDVNWLPLDNLPEEVSKSTRHVLRCIREGQIYSEFPSRTKALEFWQRLNEQWTIRLPEFGP